ncbi:MAG: hypothetical protein WDM90_23785 [Ferruginibacter sp.]
MFTSTQIVNAQLTCNNWLFTPSTPSSVRIGNIDVTGNQITIEATYNRKAYGTQYLISSIDLVGNASLGNNGPQSYYLGSELAVITTTNGRFGLLAPCTSLLNRTYHAGNGL